MKRDADNVMDALVAEDIGKFPDQNLAESLQRISGVAIDRMRGEGAAVSIRGLGPQFTRVLVNGRGALSGGTQAFAGNIGDHTQQRTFRFESMQAELVQAVEVYKSVQANLLEGGMGGTINIRTRRPFDNGGRRIVAGNVFMTDDALADENGYRFAGVYSDAFADNTLGFLVSVAGDDRITREDWFNIVGYRAAGLQQGHRPGHRRAAARGCEPARYRKPRPSVAATCPATSARASSSRTSNGSTPVPHCSGARTSSGTSPLDVLHSQMDRDYHDFQAPWRSQAGLAQRRERGAAQREPDRDVHPHGDRAATSVPAPT